MRCGRCLKLIRPGSAGVVDVWHLALAEAVEKGKELGEADGCGFCSLDFRVAGGAEDPPMITSLSLPSEAPVRST